MAVRDWRGGGDGENEDLVGRAQSEDRDPEYKRSEEGPRTEGMRDWDRGAQGSRGGKPPRRGVIRRHPEFKTKNGEGKSEDGGLRKEGVRGRMGLEPADRSGVQEGTHTCQNYSLFSISMGEAASSPQTPGTPHTCCPPFTDGENELRRERHWACGAGQTEAAPDLG